MIGKTLWSEFFNNRDWPLASAVAVRAVARARHSDRTVSAAAATGAGGRAMKRPLFLVQRDVDRARLRISLHPDPALVIYSFNDSKLVTVWGGWSTRWYGSLLENQGLKDAAWVTIRVARPVSHGRNRPRHTRRDHAGAARPLPWSHAVLGHDLCAARDARGYHRSVAAAAVRRTRILTAASGRSPSRISPSRCASQPSSCRRAWLISINPSKRPQWISARRRSTLSSR